MQHATARRSMVVARVMDLPPPGLAQPSIGRNFLGYLDLIKCLHLNATCSRLNGAELHQ